MTKNNISAETTATKTSVVQGVSMRLKLFVAHIVSKYISKKYNTTLLAATDLTPIILNSAIFTKISCELQHRTVETSAESVGFYKRYKLKWRFLADEDTVNETYVAIVNKIKQSQSRMFYILSDSQKMPCGKYYLGTPTMAKRICKLRSGSWYIVEVIWLQDMPLIPYSATNK